MTGSGGGGASVLASTTREGGQAAAAEIQQVSVAPVVAFELMGFEAE